MSATTRIRAVTAALTLAAVAVVWSAGAWAQQAPGGRVTARAAAPIDLTGQWVSIIADDWRWRVVVPPKGDTLYLPVNDAGKKVAEQWDAARDAAAGEACRAYGAGGLMHLPTRLRISWEGDETLTLETDTGQQTRRFQFDPAATPGGEPSWQGFSKAVWEIAGGAGRGARAGGPRPGSSMRVTTSRMRPGYYRRNGVPYGANATMTEWFTTISEPDGATYLLVTKILEDSQYMSAPYVRTVQFKKESGTDGWNPVPCS